MLLGARVFRKQYNFASIYFKSIIISSSGGFKIIVATQQPIKLPVIKGAHRCFMEMFSD